MKPDLLKRPREGIGQMLSREKREQQDRLTFRR